MNVPKLLKIILAGVIAASLICLIIGAATYFPALGSLPQTGAQDYAVLVKERAASMRLGMLIIMVGCASLGMAVLALLGIVIYGRLKDLNGNNIQNNDKTE